MLTTKLMVSEVESMDPPSREATAWQARIRTGLKQEVAENAELVADYTDWRTAGGAADLRGAVAAATTFRRLAEKKTIRSGRSECLKQ